MLATLVMMEQVSEYYSWLSAESKQRYTDKVIGVGLRKDPYAIPSELWLAEPDLVPDVKWSDMFVYMVATPSAYTKAEIKVCYEPLISGSLAFS